MISAKRRKFYARMKKILETEKFIPLEKIM